jgi:NAD(P)-dependent dehydrogenase (short-subunit alcohol dehydrogenase family)
MGQRYALVTAAGQGLGNAIAQHLVQQGYFVFVHYYTSSPAIGPAHRTLFLQADLTHRSARERLLHEVGAVTSQLHVLVNNLGWYVMERLPRITLEQWELALTLNCTVTFHLTQLALPLLEAARPAARIINLGDSACDRITARMTATPYHIAKLGVHVLTRSYAQLLMPKGITVNMISPGFLQNSVGSPPAALPTGAAGDFADVLGALDYLLSAQANHVSGTNLLVTGAWNLD